MPPEDADLDHRPRRWGSASALLDDDEARRRLVAAAGRCIVRRGSARLSMAQVADEAGVARSTVYRYFATRDEVVLALLLSRLDGALTDVVRSLPRPDDAGHSLMEVVLRTIGLVEGNPLNEALFSADSHPFVAALELSSEPVLEATFRHVGPLLVRWQAEGQLQPDLDLRETVRWTIAVGLMLLGPPWRARPLEARRTAVEHYFVRALLAS
jgi:AcrR family transcriptional regulator